MVVARRDVFHDVPKASSRVWWLRHIPDADARGAAWRDFQEGFTPAERAYFVAPDGNGQIGVSAAGQVARGQMGPQQPPAERRRDEHVRILIDAAQDPGLTYFVMPIPVFQVMPPPLQWVTAVATGPGWLADRN